MPKRTVALFLAALLTVAAVIPLLQVRKAHAYGLVTSRFIKLSSSKQADTDVTYSVGFTIATTGNIGGVIVNICQDSPIIGDTCTAPTSFKFHAKSGDNTLALANQSGITDFQVDTTGATDNILVLSRTGGAASVSASTAIAVDLGSTGGSDGVDNPNNTNTTFYARILTYDTQAHAEAYSPTAAGGGTGAVDAGGIALSTANQITITSKVQERLAFCVYTGANCAAGGSSVALGNDKGVLDPAGPFVDKTTKYDVSTNAASGVAIRVKGDTLKSGSFDITAIGGTAASSSAGSEQFGFCNYQSTGSGLTPAAPYNNGNCSTTTQTAGTASTGGNGTAQFAFDTTNTNTTYGQTFANKTAGSTSTGVIAFIGNISNTTEAAIYTTTLTFIATGTY
jgi:hypothetical protein